MPKSFAVQRDDLTRTTQLDRPSLQPDAGEVVLSVDRFALTANNITYGLTGDKIGYWKFFPAEAPWGMIPVWAVARVTGSAHPELEVGARVYGYFPMGGELLVKPKITTDGFVDESPHRAELADAYNSYSLMTVDKGYDPARDNHLMVYNPLFTTGYVLDDYLADNEFFGGGQVVLGSASSKTAMGLAFQLHQRGGRPVIGLTSATNREFVAGLGLYDRVLSYDEVEELERVPTVFVDMAGNRPVLARLHHHLGEQVVCSSGVGATHWDQREGEATRQLPGSRPKMFFAPAQIAKRFKELGPRQYLGQIKQASLRFFDEVDRWVTIEEHPYAEVEAIYRQVLSGAPPDRAFVIVS